MVDRHLPLRTIFDAASEDEETALDPYQCEYCGQWLRDKGIAFLEHVVENETCRYLWGQSNEHAKREAGGS